MRGRPLVRPLMAEKRGNTPAYAGKTLRIICQTWSQKHPRVCGEDSIPRHRHKQPRETPPRMRGRLSQTDVSLSAVRNTPAYAGKTLTAAACRFDPEKHPRVCGEDNPPLLHLCRPRETPPRMRGRPNAYLLDFTFLGNTPAYAGKTHPELKAEVND